MGSAIERCTEEYGIRKEDAEAEIRRINRNRIHHYEYYTDRKWGEPHHYNLMLNTGSISLETACKLIKDIYGNFVLNVSTVISALLVYNTTDFIYRKFSFKNYYRKFIAFIYQQDIFVCVLILLHINKHTFISFFYTQ